MAQRPLEQGLNRRRGIYAGQRDAQRQTDRSGTHPWIYVLLAQLCLGAFGRR